MTANTKKNTTNTLALILLAAALAFIALAITPDISHAFIPKNNHLICWAVDTNTCNSPSGDCFKKKYGDTCYRCTGAATLNAACVYITSGYCISGSNQVDCGDRRAGHCDSNKLCDGNQNAGTCIVYPCAGGVAQ